MISDIAGSIAEWFLRISFGFPMIYYLLLIIVWKLGIRFNEKKNSRLIWGALCVLGLFALTVSGSFGWILFFGSNKGLGGLGLGLFCFLSCFFFVYFIALMRKTIAAAFNRPEKPRESAKIVVAGSLLFIFLFIIMAVIG